MKASKAQSRIIKQQEQMLSVLTMIAGAVGLEAYDVQTALDVQENIAPTKKPKRTREEVNQDLADSEEPIATMPDSRDMSQSVPEQQEGDNSDSPEPNELPDVTSTALTEAFNK